MIKINSKKTTLAATFAGLFMALSSQGAWAANGLLVCSSISREATESKLGIGLACRSNLATKTVTTRPKAGANADERSAGAWAAVRGFVADKPSATGAWKLLVEIKPGSCMALSESAASKLAEKYKGQSLSSSAFYDEAGKLMAASSCDASTAPKEWGTKGPLCQSLEKAANKEGGLGAGGVSCREEGSGVFLSSSPRARFAENPRPVLLSLMALSEAALPKSVAAVVQLDGLDNPTLCTIIMPSELAGFGEAWRRDGGLDKIAPKGKSEMEMSRGPSVEIATRTLLRAHALPELHRQVKCPGYDKQEIVIYDMAQSGPKKP